MRRLFSLLMLGAVLTATAEGAPARLRLATTTSTRDSGLLDHLLPSFEADCRCKVDVIAVGTGKALELGKRGDADLLLVHAPRLEEAFMKEGWGARRVPVMHNDFVVVGPASDSAGVKGAKVAADALKRIATHQATFVSRADRSGTHEKEQELWQAAGVKPEGKWYVEAGQGMGEVLNMASEKNAYTLADRGTYVAFKKKSRLVVLSEGDPVLRNPYSAITLDPARNPRARHELADRLVAFLTGAKGRKLIESFKVSGQQLFFVP